MQDSRGKLPLQLALEAKAPAEVQLAMFEAHSDAMNKLTLEETIVGGAPVQLGTALSQLPVVRHVNEVGPAAV